MKFVSLAQAGGVALFVLLVVLASGRGPAQVSAQTGPWVAPASEKAKKNPLPAEKKTIDQGAKVAKVNCASCHGPMGKGNGPAAVALNPKPADWTSKRVQDEPDGEIFWKITTGRGAMPAWRHLSENDRWALVRYIRTLAGK
jgi:mono/diheme cytochrome c family protein